MTLDIDEYAPALIVAYRPQTDALPITWQFLALQAWFVVKMSDRSIIK